MSPHVHAAVVLGVVGAVAAASSACGSFEDTPAATDGDGGAATDGGSGGTGDGSTDASGSDGKTPDDGGPVTERIATVTAGGVRITPTEITNAQYKAFLDDLAGKPLPQQPPECAWNTSFAPPSDTGCPLDTTKPNLPVHCVDWCDARAYCEWAGLRLCGKIGGGPNLPADRADPAKSQWQAVCGGSANWPYPYGASLNQASCNFGGGAGSAADVKSLQPCEGGYDGVFDMLGNIGEWEDSCTGTTGETDSCLIRGGYYTYTADQVECGVDDPYQRNRISAKFGIRCCSK